MDRTTAPLQLGFLTVLTEQTAYLGGYLVVNLWGRPLEFRLTSAVQPNRVQQILFGPTLPAYVCADLIGKTLVEKTALPIQLLVTDTEAALDLRLKLEVPIVWLVSEERADAPGLEVRPRQERKPALRSHAMHPGEVEDIREMVARVEQNFHLAEPFARIREAIVEARRTGVANRAA
jgi:hypothetical protein